MFGNLKVGTRLALGFGAVVALLLVIAITSVLRLATVHESAVVITDQLYPKVALGSGIIRNALENGRYIRNMLLATNDGELAKNWQSLQANKLEIDGQLKKLGGMVTSDKGKDEMRTVIERAQAADDKLERLHELAATDRAKGVEFMRAEFSPANEAFRTALDTLQQHQSQEMDDASRHGGEVYTTTSELVIGLSVGAVLLAAGIGFLITRNLGKVLGGEPAYAAEVMRQVATGDFTVDVAVRAGDTSSLLFTTRQMVQSAGASVADVVRVMGAMAAGDLTQKIEKSYTGSFGEMKDYVNETVGKLAQVVTEVNSSAEALAGASEEVSATAQSLSQAASEQAAGVEETSASMEQMTASISQNTENAKVTD
ncbi:MAG TPA: MCP four helix bundle domain-containing protein, partial [Burkholderiaceae bacterium]